MYENISPIEKQRGASSKGIEVLEKALAPVLALLLWDTFALGGENARHWPAPVPSS